MFLVGLLLREGDDWRYEAIWAHDRDGERVAFERLVDLLTDRLARYPDMHVYHYSAAEPSDGQAADGPARHARGRGRRPAAPQRSSSTS